MNAMNCQRMEELLPDYLQNALSPAQTAEVEQHCEHCANCAQDIVMWKKLALLPEEKPSAESRQRFDAMLHSYSVTAAETAAQTRSNARASQPQQLAAKPSWNFIEWLRSPFGAVAWSAALLLIGLYAGTHRRQPRRTRAQRRNRIAARRSHQHAPARRALDAPATIRQ